MRASGESNQPAWPGRCLRVKVNLLIFKDEKTKDAVTYHSWQWDIAIFHCSGWDDQHLLPYVLWSLQGFLGDLARSLGGDAALNDILHMLNKHYGMVITFDALSKEPYSLKQGLGEIMAEFRVHLLQQVQILQSEYLGRVWQEHIEEMNWDHFYKGLNPKYQRMLSHKIDGEHPAGYSDLLLATWNLERQAEARDSLLLKTTPTGGSNIAHSETSGNLLPSWKLKGSHTFTANQLWWKVTELQKNQAWRQKRKKGMSLQKERTKKPQVELEEQINQLAILSILPMWSSCIRGKLKIVSDVVVMTISWKIVQRISARPPEKQV